MADNKARDQNATPPNPDDNLRGGTQGGGAPPVNVGGPSGGTNSISPAGGVLSDRDYESGGTRTGSREDAEDLFEGTRKPSHAEAKQHARDAADAPTAPRTPHGAGEPRDHAIHKDR